MESTGVYWRPVHAVLEEHFEVIVGNARHIRNVPGRKTDVKDAEWIADLVCCGLIRPSFVPPKPLRELRELLRYRRKLTEAQASRTQPATEAAGDRQHQAGQCRHRRVRRIRPGDRAGVDRQHHVAHGDGRSGAWPPAQQARRTDPCAQGTAGRHAAVPAVDAVAPGRRHRTADRDTRPAHRREAGAVPGRDGPADADTRASTGWLLRY